MSDDINPLYGDYKPPAAQEVEPSAPAAEEQRLANLEHNRKFDEAVRAARRHMGTGREGRD